MSKEDNNESHEAKISIENVPKNYIKICENNL